MTWFSIIKYDVASKLKEMFPNAKVKLVGNIWKLLFNNQQDWENAYDVFRNLEEDLGLNFGTTTHKDLWIINFENKELYFPKERWV